MPGENKRAGQIKIWFQLFILKTQARQCRVSEFMYFKAII